MWSNNCERCRRARLVRTMNRVVLLISVLAACRADPVALTCDTLTKWEPGMEVTYVHYLLCPAAPSDVVPADAACDYPLVWYAQDLGLNPGSPQQCIELGFKGMDRLAVETECVGTEIPEAPTPDPEAIPGPVHAGFDICVDYVTGKN